jgi:hypothetical protein
MGLPKFDIMVDTFPSLIQAKHDHHDTNNEVHHTFKETDWRGRGRFRWSRGRFHGSWHRWSRCRFHGSWHRRSRSSQRVLQNGAPGPSLIFKTHQCIRNWFIVELVTAFILDTTAGAGGGGIIIIILRHIMDTTAGSGGGGIIIDTTLCFAVVTKSVEWLRARLTSPARSARWGKWQSVISPRLWFVISPLLSP